MAKATTGTWYRCTCDELDHVERKWWKFWRPKVYWKRNPRCPFHGDASVNPQPLKEKSDNG